MSIHADVAASVGATVLVLQLAAPGLSATQDYRQDHKPAEYQITTIYDRIADSTRISAVLLRQSRAFGLGSWVSVDAAITFAGRQPTGAVGPVALTFESFTPSRGGWAFARPQRLKVRSGNAVQLEIPPAEYVKRRVHVFDAGRRESLSFRIPAEQFAALSAEPELKLKAGPASVRLRERGMAVMRQLVQRIRPSLQR
jgi:hypothetical protein